MHVIGPQLGLTQPGMTIVCGDSHTTHPRRVRRAGLRHRHQRGRARAGHPDAAAAPARRRWRSPSTASCRRASPPRTSILALIAQIGTGGGQGHIVEYRGSAIAALSMEGRMTICNMSIEAGARAGMIAPDETTFAYLKGRPHAPQGADWDAARGLLADAAHRRRTRRSTARSCSTRPSSPRSSPGAPTRARACRCPARVPDPAAFADADAARRGRARAGVHGPARPARRCATSRWTRSSSAPAPTAGSRTCGPPPRSCEGRKVADGVRMLVVPGSMRVQAAGRGGGPGRGLHRRRRRVARGRLLDVPGHEPGPARAGRALAPRTSNRNFEGRQGKGGRTHLVSPPVAAATAVTGRLSAPADL